MNYTLREISAIVGGIWRGADLRVGSLFADSRSSAPADMFAAIEGRNHDGHDYINELYARGVRAFLMEREVDLPPDAGVVRVDSSLKALQALAAHWRAQFKGTVVAITGSNGKTVVKEWVAATAPAGVRLFRSPRSYNSQLGVPLSVLMMTGNEDVAVFEAGISHPGEMASLARILRPDIGVFTTLGDAHQENFSSLAEKAAEKSLLFEGARTIIYNSRYGVEFDAPNLINVGGNTPAAECDVRDGCRPPREAAACDASGSAPEVCGSPLDATSENALLVEALWRELGHSIKAGCTPPMAMRLEVKEGVNGSLIVDDTYSADLNSLGIALDYLRTVAGGRPRTLILGDILQSGLPDDVLYEQAAELAARSGVERIIGIGERISRGFMKNDVSASSEQQAASDKRAAEHVATADGGRNATAQTVTAFSPSAGGVLSTSFHPSVESFLASITRDDIAGRAILIKGNRMARFERLSHALGLRSHTTTLTVNLDALVHNLNTLRVPGLRTVAMVKADAYGHGAHEVAATMQHQGVDYLAVAFADEGVQLRRAGITMPVVVLNADSDSFDLMVGHGLDPEIYNFESLAAFAETVTKHGEREWPVHIKLDTGMHRLGFAEEYIERLTAELARLNGTVRVGSIFSHLSCADDPTQDDFTRTQIASFERMTTLIISGLGYHPLLHLANSAGAVRFPQARFDMVRLGLGLYGFGDERLKPISALRTRIVQVRDLPAGAAVGYARAGVLNAAGRVAIIPMGYADGLNRHLGGGRWSMQVRGAECPTIGRVSMDTCAILVPFDAQVGDEVTIFDSGEGGTLGHTAADMAAVLGTIPYEVMTSISSRVKKIYIKE